MHLLKHYLFMALRQAQRSKAYALINIAGLALALSCAIMMSLYILDELHFDRFHTRADRIYRVVNGNTAKVPPPLGTALKNAFPEIQAFASLRPSLQGWMMQYKDRVFYETQGYWSNATLFQVFDFPLLKGNPTTALSAPYAIVISESMASKYFGNEDPLGKTFAVNDGWGDLLITGVMRDIPPNSHLQADFFISLNTLVQRERERLNRDALRWVRVLHHYIYIVLPENYPAEHLESRLPEFVQNETHVNPIVFMEQALELQLQPLTDIHLHSHLDSEISPNSNPALLYSLIAVTVFILLIASINFVNLVTARTSTRLREIGVKKAIGAHRQQLICQFLSESLATTLISSGVALAILLFTFPIFQILSGKDIVSIWHQWPLEISLGILVFVCLLGLLAGVYPAYFLSAFKPHETRKGDLRTPLFGSHLRRCFVTLQFTISITLIICASSVYTQWTYLRTKSLGFDKNHVIVIKQRGRVRSRNQYTALQNQLLQNPDIINVTASDFLPGIEGDLESISAQRPGNKQQYIYCFDTGLEVVQAMGLELLAGRGFSSDYAIDRNFKALLINETTVRRFGWSTPEEAIDQILISEEWNGEGYVIGVVKDFNFKSLHQPVDPVVMTPDGRGFIAIRYREGRVENVIKTIERTWIEHFLAYPLEYTLMQDNWDYLYASEEQLGKLLGVFSLLSIGIACLGLLGLVSFMTERRTREIGIRKVLGASTGRIVWLLSREIAHLVLIANLFAWPIAYWTMNLWLQSFAYRIDLHLTTFILASTTACMIAILSVGYYTTKVATTNPVNALRYE